MEFEGDPPETPPFELLSAEDEELFFKSSRHVSGGPSDCCGKGFLVQQRGRAAASGAESEALS